MKNTLKALIIGGAGYIGSHCNKYFNQKGVETVILDNLSTGFGEFVKWGQFIHGDLHNSHGLSSIFSQHKIDVVIHFAACAEVGESVSDPAKYYYNNLLGTFNLLEQMRIHQVDKIVFSSTCATYGMPEKVPIAEDHPQKPINPYGNTKLAVELMLQDFCHAYGINYVALRYFNAAGADPEGEVGESHSPESHLIPLVLDAISGKRADIKIFGEDYDTPDGTCIRDYIHVMDLADAHYLAWKWLSDNNKSTVFNLGNGQGYSVKEIINTAIKVTGKECTVTKSDRRPGDPPRLIAAAGKALNELGWNPQYADIEVIIEHAWNWHQKGEPK